MPALNALFAQVLALLLVMALARYGWLPEILRGQLLVLAVMQGMCAALIAWWRGAARWWLPIHLLFMPVLVAALWAGLPSWLYLVSLVLLVLVYWSSYRTQVPLFLSNRATVEQLVAWLPNDQPLRVLDAGSGTGSFARRLAQLRREWQVTGIESAPAPYWLSRWLGRRQNNLRLLRGDFWQDPLHNYDVVYAFLSPVPMPALWRKARSEMRPGTLLVSNSFVVPGETPEVVLQVKDRRGTQLYCYRM